jgi:hypothetical protein
MLCSPGALAPGLKKSHSLNSIVSIKATGNERSKYDVEFPEKQISFVAPPPQRIFTIRNVTVTASAHPPHRILTVSNDLCIALEFSMAELQDRSISIMFGPETDISAITSAMKAVHTDIEHQAIIPAIQIYARNGSCHLFDIHCVLEKTCDEDDSPITMCFKSVQPKQQPVARSSRRNSVSSLHREARSRYNFITGLGLHASSVQSGTLRIA